MATPQRTAAGDRAAAQRMTKDWDAGHLPPIDCGACTACCRGDTIFLTPDDDLANYRHKKVDGRPALKRDARGNCIYLGSGGCTIQNRKPLACRLYDCRVAFEMVLRMGSGEDRQRKMQSEAVTRGRELYAEMTRTPEA